MNTKNTSENNFERSRKIWRGSSHWRKSCWATLTGAPTHANGDIIGVSAVNWETVHQPNFERTRRNPVTNLQYCRQNLSVNSHMERCRICQMWSWNYQAHLKQCKRCLEGTDYMCMLRLKIRWPYLITSFQVPRSQISRLHLIFAHSMRYLTYWRLALIINGALITLVLCFRNPSVIISFHHWVLQ